MTPAERAQQLFDQMDRFQPGSLNYKLPARVRAKECAIIAVDLLITETNEHSIANYWTQVLHHLKEM
jgi:predicted RNA-binding protein